MKRILFAWVALTLLTTLCGKSVAEEVSVWDLNKADKDGISPGWEIKQKDGKPKYCLVTDGDVKALCLKSEKSSFSVERKISVNLKEYPYLTWRWKVLELPKGGDFRQSDKDDQAAQMFVAFPGGKSISYIWDTTAPVGAVGTFSVPLVMKVKIVVVNSGDAEMGKWVTVTRNVYEDYKTLYGKEPPLAEGLRYQINSQHTGTSAESRLASLEFKKNP